MAVRTCSLSFVFLLAISLSTVEVSANRCAYTIDVQTGDENFAGTDSLISLTLTDQNKKNISIPNLEEWGDMDSGYNYFEKGKLDAFIGIAPCFSSPVCSITLVSDGTGSSPGWYVDYLNITACGPETDYKRNFIINQWLDPGSSYNLSTTIDNCQSISMLYDEHKEQQ